MYKLKKYEGNPILKPNPKKQWEVRCVLNPAVVYNDEKDEFVMLYRAAGDDIRHQIRLGLATSKDGIHFERQSDDPIFEGQRFEVDGGCVEDPRLMKIGDVYYLTYAARAYPPGRYWVPRDQRENPLDETDFIADELPLFAKDNITITCLAGTKNFRTYKKFGRITEATVDDRDVFLFPEKINGKYAMISRPKFSNVPEIKMPSIWISFGEDLIEYEKPELLMTGEEWWETQRIGGGTPPIKTDKGWFMLYHGVDDQGTYRVGAVMMDLKDPRKIIARTKHFIMEPEEPYETSGLYNCCVFPTGTVVKDGTLYIYYGCADEYVGLATANFDELVDYLMTECKIETN